MALELSGALEVVIEGRSAWACRLVSCPGLRVAGEAEVEGAGRCPAAPMGELSAGTGSVARKCRFVTDLGYNGRGLSFH